MQTVQIKHFKTTTYIFHPFSEKYIYSGTICLQNKIKLVIHQFTTYVYLIGLSPNGAFQFRANTNKLEPNIAGYLHEVQPRVRFLCKQRASGILYMRIDLIN